MLLNRDSGRVVVADVTKIIHMSSAVNNMVIPDSGYASCHPHSSKSELCVYILRSSMSKTSNHDLSAKKKLFWESTKKKQFYYMERSKQPPPKMCQIRKWSKSRIWTSGALFLTKWTFPNQPKFSKRHIVSWKIYFWFFFMKK